MLIDKQHNIANAAREQHELLLLPRPWLRVDASDVIEREPLRICDESYVCAQLYRVRGIKRARIFVKGSIEHPEHEPILLPYWHQVIVPPAYPTEWER